MKILILNGPNLNLLGTREPGLYGTTSFESFFEGIKSRYAGIEFQYVQTNHEGTLIDQLHQSEDQFDGVIINPAAYTHTSIALGDAVRAIKTPVVEVHLTNIYKREGFRQKSFIKDHCMATIMGHGLRGYDIAVDFFLNDFKKEIKK